jgi:hypothetical protein
LDVVLDRRDDAERHGPIEDDDMAMVMALQIGRGLRHLGPESQDDASWQVEKYTVWSGPHALIEDGGQRFLAQNLCQC